MDCERWKSVKIECLKILFIELVFTKCNQEIDDIFKLNIYCKVSFVHFIIVHCCALIQDTSRISSQINEN